MHAVLSSLALLALMQGRSGGAVVTSNERVTLHTDRVVVVERLSEVSDAGELPVLLERTLFTADGARVRTQSMAATTAATGPDAFRSAQWERTEQEVRAAVAAEGLWAQDATLWRQRDPRSGRPGWRVRVRPDPRTLSRPTVWVDDASLWVQRGPDQTRQSQAWAYPRNPLLDAMPERYELEAVPQMPATLADTRFDVRNCGDPGGPAFCELDVVEPDRQGDFLFTPPTRRAADHERPHDRFAAGSIYVHADRFAAFAELHDLPLPPCASAETPGLLLANYQGFTGRERIPVANAGYTGDCELMAFFGQGPHADWGYDADVVVHELTHGMIAAQMGPDRVLGRPALRPDGVSEDAGALGEAVSDFVAALNSGDPAHAEYTRAFDGGLARSADNDLRCPQDLRGEIHADSEPMAGALWEASETLGPALVRPVVHAIAMLGEDASFEEASAAFLEFTALELGARAEVTLREALQRHNLLSCERVVAVEDAPSSLLLLPNSGATGRYEPMRPPPLQFRVDVPPGQSTMEVSFDVVVSPDPGWAPLGDVHVLVRADAPLAFSYTTDDRGVVQVDASPDLHIPNVAGPGAETGRFTVEVAGAEAVYLALFNQGLHRARVSAIDVTFDDDPTGASETGSDSETGRSTGPHETGGLESTGAAATGGGSGQASGSAGSAGCRVGPRGSGSALWLLTAVYAALMRRRRQGAWARNSVRCEGGRPRKVR